MSSTKVSLALMSVTKCSYNTTVPLTDSLQLLGVELSSKLNFGQYIESKAQMAAKTLGILSTVRRHFTPKQLLQLYQAQVRSCIYRVYRWSTAATYEMPAD